MERLLALVEKMNAEYTAFKAENDRRLKEIESKGRSDPLTEEKINKHSAALGELQAQIDKLTMQLQRKGSGAGGDQPDAAAKAHSKAFDRFLRTGDVNALRELNVQGAAVSVGSDTEGGYLVPGQMDSVIEKYERDMTPMRQYARVITVANEHYEKLVKQGEASSGWVGEQEARPDTNAPTWALLTPFFGEIYAKPKVTQKALDDAGINLEAELGEDVGVEFAEKENTAYTTGDGVKKPKGLLAYTMSTQADGTRPLGQIQKLHSGSAGNFVADKLIDLVYLLHEGYLANAAWMMNRSSLGAIRKLKDGQNNYLWQPSLVPGVPEMLLGYPIRLNSGVAAPAVDALAATFGDLRRAYQVVDVRGVRMLRDPYTDKPFVVFYSTKRTGGFVVNDRAVKVYALSA